jgi:hypothetical protein
MVRPRKVDLYVQANIVHPVALAVREKYRSVNVSKLVTAALIALGDASQDVAETCMLCAYGLKVHPSQVPAPSGSEPQPNAPATTEQAATAA